jgi:hypothetical protein
MQTQRTVSPVRARLRGFDVKPKVFKAVQYREANDHRLRRNVPGIGNIIKVEVDEVGSRQEQLQ